METQGVQLLLFLLLCAVTCWGQQIYLTLGSGPRITTNNTEILITTIGEDADGGLPSLTCHTDLTTCCRSSDNNGMGPLGQWTFPGGSVVLQNGGSMNAGDQFYILRGAPQVIRLARRQANNPLTPTGSYCCTVPTGGGGEMTLCANLVSSFTSTVAPTSVTCSDNLPILTNGGITYGGGSTNNRPVGATAEYSCFGNYTLVGVSVRTCGSDGEWSSTTAPVCQLITCSDLSSLTNGDIDYGGAGSTNNRPVGTVATYTCNTGYTLNGGSTRTCGSDGVWRGSAPVCQPNCPDLPSLTNGMIMYSAGSTNNRPFSSSAVYSCNTGYTLTGGTTRVCLTEGIWDGSPPTCQGPTDPPPTTCPDLTIPTNGMISYSAGSPGNRPIFSAATYTCNTGYTLTGSATIRTCTNGGRWTGSPPTCQVNTVNTDPPPTTCSDLIAPTNGMIGYNMGTASPRPVNTVATHTCNPGYTLNGGSTRTCRSDGLWSGSAQTCQQILICSDLPSLPNGAISYNDGSTDIRPLNTIATHSCNTGYTLNGDSVRVCQNDRTWNGSPPTCQVSCRPPPSITNGSPGQPTSTMIGGDVTYTCDTGFILIGSETITCLSTGNWSSSPSCQIPPPVYLSLSSTNYLSGLSEIPLSSVGEGSGLVCHTDLAGCCERNTGDWYYPNGSVVMEDGALYVSRGQMSVSLMMSGTAAAPGGVYCCVVPTSGGTSTACIVLASTDESSMSAQCDNTGAVVGGVVALVAVIAVTVVMVTYLVLRYKRGGKMTVPRDIPLTDQGQSAAATYETVPATYEEIPASREVKGDYSYTQNNAYSTVSGREAPAGGIYNKTELSHDSSRK